MSSKEKPSKELIESWKNDPSLWKWGLFYYNPSDKRIFPPKRIGFLGWTINFANPLSVLTLPITVALLYLASMLLKSES
jgi:uncharacterized membrane protein